jgi:hypothetical protein
MKVGLLDSVITLTGLSDDGLESELRSLIVANQVNPEEINLEQLRDVMVDYLNSVFLELANHDGGK